MINREKKYLPLICGLLFLAFQSCNSGREKNGQDSTESVRQNKEQNDSLNNNSLSQANVDSKNLFRIKNSKEYSFKIDNSDSLKLGYKAYEADETDCPRGICLNGDYVFLSDPLHNNIKRIDIKSGKIITSKKLSRLPLQIRNIVLFNDYLYCISDADSIFVLDVNFKKIESIPGKYNQVKRVFKNSNDTLKIVLGTDQLKNLDYKYEMLVITKDTVFINRKYILPIKEHAKITKNLLSSGKNVTLNSDHKPKYITNEFGDFELPNDVNEIENYTSNLIAFSDKLIVLGQVNEKGTKYVLRIFEY